MFNSDIVLVVSLALIGMVLGYFIGDFIGNKTNDEKIAAVKEWLLFCVTKMESIYGSGTGQIKLRAAWDLALQRFPFLSVLVTFDEFSKWIDEALEQMKEMLKNEKIGDFVITETLP